MSKKNIKLMNISGKENCDICKNKEYLEVHHINGREIKDAEKSYNLTNICSNCHYKVHLGEIIIEKWVMSTDGRQLIFHKKGEENLTGEESSPHKIFEKRKI